MKIENVEVKIIKGDITDLQIDAIVNATSDQMTMDDSALSRTLKEKGGQVIEDEAVTKGCDGIGDAVATSAGSLKAKYIIHAVSMDAQTQTDETIIRNAAASALQCADVLGVRSIAFPALGRGVENFPLVGTAKIMTQEIIKYLKHSKTNLEEIIFCLHDDAIFEVFNNTMSGYVEHIQKTLGPGPYVTVDAIIEVSEGIILIERSHPPYGWALPGGFLNYGESLEEAATREAKEETNMDLVNLRQFHTYSKLGRDPRFQTISTVFVAEGKGEPKAGDDAKNFKIVRYADLLELEYAFDHKEIIKEYLVEKEFGDDHF